jgi:hypothetical protein
LFFGGEGVPIKSDPFVLPLPHYKKKEGKGVNDPKKKYPTIFLVFAQVLGLVVRKINLNNDIVTSKLR